MNAKELDLMAGGKRDDPNYAQVSGYVPKKLALEFKIACTADEISQSEALEQAMTLWLGNRTKQQSE